MAYRTNVLAWVGALMVAASFASAAPAGESERLARAKDLIADELWRRAIVELRAAYEDPKEPAKDEAAFWLAHSLFQAGDAAAALQTIEQLERRFARSRWLFPARSLKLEIAHRLNREDMLWTFATPPVAPAPPAPPGPAAPPVGPALAPPAVPPPPPPAAPPPTRVRPRRQWVGSMDEAGAELMALETDLRIQALGSLIRREPARAVPILKEVALTTPDERQARRAVFVLMHSNRVDARQAVAEIARSGPEPVRLAAVRELGLVRSPESARLLRDLYVSASEPVKVQVIRALGSARQPQPLLQIARTEAERPLRESAIAALGQAGARTQLASLYRQEPELRQPIISALFTAAGEDELIGIASTERTPRLRAAAVDALKLLGTPRARAFVEKMR